jgi:hypothetical protein
MGEQQRQGEVVIGDVAVVESEADLDAAAGFEPRRERQRSFENVHRQPELPRLVPDRRRGGPQAVKCEMAATRQHQHGSEMAVPRSRRSREV